MSAQHVTSVEEVLRAAAMLPTVPKVVGELIALLGNEFVSPALIARQLGADQVLSAKVLRLANSAYYSAPRSISSIDEAVHMLGFGVLRTLVVSTSMADSLKPVAGADLKRFLRYSLHAAVTAKYIASTLAFDGEEAFTVGLLHGIGHRLMEHGAVLPSSACARAQASLYGFSYANVGAELCRRWNFPRSFALAIEDAPAPRLNECDSLAAVVHVAAWRSLAEEEGLGPDELASTWPTEVADGIKLPRETVLRHMPPLQVLSAGLEELINA